MLDSLSVRESRCESAMPLLSSYQGQDQLRCRLVSRHLDNDERSSNQAEETPFAYPFTPPIVDWSQTVLPYIISINSVKQEEYFDFHVPLYENYWAEGCFHHNSGKSSVIRAIRWVAFNRPLGESVIRWGAKYARVVLKTEDAKVTREKGDEGNFYQIGRAKPHTAFGTGVPVGVTDVLRLEEINFQRQVDAGFWFTHSAPEVAREMNRVVDLDVIDKSQSYAASKVRAANGEIKALGSLLQEATARKASLAWVPAAERLLEEAERIAQARDTALQRLEGIKSLTGQIRRAQTTRQTIPDTSKIDTLATELEKARGRLEGIRRLVSEIKSERERLEQCRMWISQLEEDIERTRPETCPACGSVIPSGLS